LAPRWPEIKKSRARESDHPLGRRSGLLSVTDGGAHLGSTREVEVLRLVASGLTNKQIAVRLMISRNTVNIHMNSIYKKLEIPSCSAATRYAIERDLG